VLDAAIKVFMQYLPLRVRIEGHTDNVGKPETNLALSQARADSVKNYLIGKGIIAERIEAVGYGDTKPKADNKKPKGRAINRRIEFTILGNEATPPAPAPTPAPTPPAPTPPAPTPTP
jgi:outer membrane protein OmpA-like peptidoglycan-associated protein